MAEAAVAVFMAVAEAVFMVAAVAFTAAVVVHTSVVARVLRGVRVEWHRDRFQGPVVAQ